MLFIALAGCDRSDEIARQNSGPKGRDVRLTSQALSPRMTLEECVAAYGKLTSYEDSAYVRLQYQVDGKPVEDRAPLSVAWDDSGRLGLRAYSVQAGPTQGRWRLRLGDGESLVPDQVLSRAIPKHVDFAWLLADPLVGQSLSAGMAGFPPQLDLLLGEQPMGGLLDDSAMLSFEKQQVVDGRACHVISIVRGGLAYRLWIDQATMLLRRLLVPNVNVAPQMLADRRVTGILLTVELEGIRTNSTVDWQRFAVQSRPDDLLVNHFVPAPPAMDTGGLGQRLPAFHLSDASGREVYRSVDGRSGRKATVLMWLADHPACRVAAEQLAEAARTLRADGMVGEGAVEFVPIWAEPEPPPGLTYEQLAAAWQLPGKLALDRSAMGRDLFRVQEAPTLVVLDANNRLQLREARTNPLLGQLLPPLLVRLAQGEDLATEMQAQQERELAHFEAELRMATAVDAPGVRPVPKESYPPRQTRMIEIQRTPSLSDAVAATVDSQQMIWTLYDDGVLERREVLAGAGHRYQTRWTRGQGGRLLVSPNSDFVATSSAGGSLIQVFSTQSKQNRKIQLEPDVAVTDFCWLTLQGSRSPRLAVVTSDDQTILLDPLNHEQLSGRCPSQPLAIVSRAPIHSSVGGYVVLANRKVEPLQLSSDSAHDRLQRPQSRAPGRGASHTLPNPASSGKSATVRQLGFQPASGPWFPWHDDGGTLILARGWLAQDEPAVFMLDAALNQLWHYRMPLRANTRYGQNGSVARDPATGQPIWVVMEPDNTIHILRADGAAGDHFRPQEELRGVAVVPNGNRLVLVLIHPGESVSYELKWQ